MLQYTPYTLHTKDVILGDLKTVSELGFAISEQEYEEQINAVAAPIFDLEDQPIASIAVAGPAYRLTRERMIEIGPVIVTTARDITREITMAAIPLANSVVDVPVSIGNGK
jgi:DNA-binding IclR family transcriptional regulator